MQLVFEAIDEEFAASTGSNVNIVPGESRFDNPPNAFKDLVITTNDGDPDPRLFEVGDTYDLAWGGHGGNHTIEDATVVRSDAAPGGGGVIVFEGLDDAGELTHIIWTPDFDLEDWYWDNHNPSAEPNFYVTDTNSSYTHSYMCFCAETLIAGPHGPMRAGDIEPGDRVDTVDHGMQTVRWVGRMRVPADGGGAPIRFAPGTIGNEGALRLSPQHRVLIRSERAELMFGTSEVLIPAKAMVDGRGIRAAPTDRVTYIHLLLDNHELLWAEGALCESLYLGDQVQQILTELPADDPDRRMIEGLRRMPGLHDHPARLLLTLNEARALLGKAPPEPPSHERKPLVAHL